MRIFLLMLVTALLGAPLPVMPARAAGQALPPMGSTNPSGLQERTLPPPPAAPARPAAARPAAAPYPSSTMRTDAGPAAPPVILTVKSKTATTDLDDTLMQGYRRQAHRYRAAGRMELARQQLEMALAACHTEEEKALVRQELSTVNAIIKLRR